MTQQMLIQNYSLRIFGPSDLESVVNINRVCLPENYAPYFFLDTFNNLPQTFIVAESEGRVVGYTMCRLEHGLSDVKKLRLVKKGHIISVAVMPDFRRMGMGRSLVERVLSALSTLDVNECFLEVRIPNSSAIELYKKLGFEIAKTIQRYYYDGSDAYVMVKQIQ
ncbi:MAG: ribosomal protein S18-alanine N-acetyltransferase [Candidatus Bathyarchaeia archaeon]